MRAGDVTLEVVHVGADPGDTGGLGEGALGPQLAQLDVESKADIVGENPTRAA